MNLCITILKEESLLNELIKKLTNSDIKNITILSSTNVVTEKSSRKKEISILGSLRYMLDYFNDESKVILIPCSHEKIEAIKLIIADLIPNHQYLFFSLKIDNVEGKID